MLPGNVLALTIGAIFVFILGPCKNHLITTVMALTWSMNYLLMAPPYNWSQKV